MCVSQQADGVVHGDYTSTGNRANCPRNISGPVLRCLSQSPDLHSRPAVEDRRERERGRGVGVWAGWSGDGEGDPWEQRECDMILGLELFQDSVSCCNMSSMDSTAYLL